VEIAEKALLRRLAFARGFIRVGDDRSDIVPSLVRDAGRLRGKERRCEKNPCETAQHRRGFYTSEPCSFISPGIPRARR
jgi:hypothetical protein